MSLLVLFALLAIGVLLTAQLPALCEAKKDPNKRHEHNGMLHPFSGKHMGYSLTVEEAEKLGRGEPVVFKRESEGRSGQGIVIQDVQAPPEVCMDKISDLKKYPSMVPKVKKVDVYKDETFSNGTTQSHVKFTVGTAIFSLEYYLVISREPTYNTCFWTLDYEHSSDFDDNIGLWQLLPHPSVPGWTRIVYAGELKLFPWIPSFVVNFISKTALLEATHWLKVEAEKVVAASKGKSISTLYRSTMPDISACYVDGGRQYLTHCANGPEDNEGSNSHKQSYFVPPVEKEL